MKRQRMIILLVFLEPQKLFVMKPTANELKAPLMLKI